MVYQCKRTSFRALTKLPHWVRRGQALARVCTESPESGTIQSLPCLYYCHDEMRQHIDQLRGAYQCPCAVSCSSCFYYPVCSPSISRRWQPLDMRRLYPFMPAMPSPSLLNPMLSTFLIRSLLLPAPVMRIVLLSMPLSPSIFIPTRAWSRTRS